MDVASLAFAAALMFQTTPIVKNPSAVVFKCVDHATDTGHEIDIIDDVTKAVVQTIQGGDPAADANGDVTIALNVQPIKFGTYTIVVRVVAGTVKADDSAPSVVWQRVPGRATGVLVK